MMNPREPIFDEMIIDLREEYKIRSTDKIGNYFLTIQTFGTKINFHPRLHFLITEGGVDEAGLFHKVSRIDDSRLASRFAREVLTDLVRIINHLELTFVAERPPPPHIAYQEVLVAAEASAEHFA